MFKCFQEIETFVLCSNKKPHVVLAGSHDGNALSAAVYAKRKGIVDVILVGVRDATVKLLKELGESPEDYRLVEETASSRCADIACDLVVHNEADIPMKGLVHTADFMHAILNKSRGFVAEKALISQATVAEWSDQHRMLIISDCAINIQPTYDDKIKLINNAVHLANIMKNACPRVGIITPVEVVNPNMPSTTEAAMLSMAARRGQIRGCILDGPLGLDNAVSVEAAQHKKIFGDVAGQADILIMPDLCAGNVLTKAITYFAKMPTAGVVIGTNIPVIISSRSDTRFDKYRSILMAVLKYQILGTKGAVAAQQNRGMR